MVDNLEKSKQVLLYAYNLGYRVSADGKVVTSPKNTERKLVIEKRNKTNTLYYYFNVRWKNSSFPVRVHRLQAYQKYGEAIFESGIVVRHKDNNPENNSYGNIVLGTHSDNQLDRPYKELYMFAVAAAQHVRVWSDEQLQEIFDDRYLRNLTYKALKDKYGVAKSTLSFLFNKSIFAKNYKHYELCKEV